MSDQEREPHPAGGDADDDDGPAATPFDNPFFLPVLLWIFAAWFFYDGWFNPDMEWINFNRYGFGVAAALAVWFTVKGVKERREEAEGRQRDAAEHGGGSPTA